MVEVTNGVVRGQMGPSLYLGSGVQRADISV